MGKRKGTIMTYRVTAHEDPLKGQVYIHVINKLGDPPNQCRLALTFEKGIATWEEVPFGAESPYAYAFDWEIAHLIYEALRDLHGGKDVATVRLTLDGEQERIDKLVGAIRELTEEH
jgi:hypothetical protein